MRRQAHRRHATNQVNYDHPCLFRDHRSNDIMSSMHVERGLADVEVSILTGAMGLVSDEPLT